MPAARPASSSGVDYSNSAQSLGGLTTYATIASNQARNGYFVQNQSAIKVYVVFDRESGDTASVVILAAGTGTGEPGGYLDMQSLPHSGRIRILAASSVQIAAREW